MTAALKVPLTPAEEAALKSTVCVTGAGGYVASAVVQRLLAAGHTVHAAVRSKSNASHLLALPGAAERLKLFEGCDLTKQGSFDAAIAGCDYVMHMASPFCLGVSQAKVKDLLLTPAIEGTKNVLGAVNRTPSVKRVVHTSSIAAILSYPDPDKVYTENDWNEQASENQFAYELSKTLAEKAAWQIHDAQDRWSMVALNPGLVMGPPLCNRPDAESIHVMKRIMRGDMCTGYPEYFLRTVDVRDVAKAHCLAMITPDAKGRYLLTPNLFTFGRVAEVLRAGPLGKHRQLRLRLPSKPLFIGLLWVIADIIKIERYRLVTTYGKMLKTDCSKAERELGMTWLPDTDTYNDMAVTLVRMGITPWIAKTKTDAIAPSDAPITAAAIQA